MSTGAGKELYGDTDKLSNKIQMVTASATKKNQCQDSSCGHPLVTMDAHSW